MTAIEAMMRASNAVIRATSALTRARARGNAEEICAAEGKLMAAEERLADRRAHLDSAKEKYLRLRRIARDIAPDGAGTPHPGGKP